MQRGWRAAMAAPRLPLLLVQLVALAVAPRASWCQQQDSSVPLSTPRIYVYELPEELLARDASGFPMQLAADLKASDAYTTDGDAADYWWIPGSGHYPQGQEHLLRTFDYIRQTFPWWNRTRELGQARHVLVTLSDHGPGEAAFRRPIFVGNGVPDDVNPASPTRNVIFMSMNGLRDVPRNPGDNCGTCLQPGKDIMFPTPEMICGPLCGYNVSTLRKKSIWRLKDDALQAELVRPRKYRLFYAGTISNPDKSDFTGRGGIYHHYVNRTDYLVARSGEYPERISFPDAMLDSTFCYSPMGQSGGDTDRYVASIMFGCIPVLLNSSHGGLAVPHSLPFEEVLHWERFGTIINTFDLKHLDEQLACLEPYVPMMRLAMKEVWQRLLWSTAYKKAYVHESKRHDAMHTLMQLLAQRAAHGYQPSKATMERLAHHTRRFPCTNRPARYIALGPHGHDTSWHAEGSMTLQSHVPAHHQHKHLQRHAVSHQDLANSRRLLRQLSWE